MSLINDMLRDLDSRNAASSERNGLAQNVRALPATSTQRHISPLLLMLGAALLGGGAVWFLLRPPASTPAPQPVSAPALPAPAAPAVIAEPSAPTVATPPAETPQPVPETPVLRLDTTISKPPVAKPEAQPHTPAPATLPQAKVTTTTSTTTRVAEAPRSNASTQISKQPTAATSANEQAEIEYRRGLAAIRRGDAAEGGEAFRAALRASPMHAAARQALLAQFTEQQRWADAETLALDGVGLYPQRSDWALLSARLMYERGDASAALAVLDQYAAAARQNADYQILRALLLQRAGRHADAADCYQTALAIRPQEGRWWYGLGRALDADHRDALARQAFEKARETGNLPPELQQEVERRLR